MKESTIILRMALKHPEGSKTVIIDLEDSSWEITPNRVSRNGRTLAYWVSGELSEPYNKAVELLLKEMDKAYDEFKKTVRGAIASIRIHEGQP